MFQNGRGDPSGRAPEPQSSPDSRIELDLRLPISFWLPLKLMRLHSGTPVQCRRSFTGAEEQPDHFDFSKTKVLLECRPAELSVARKLCNVDLSRIVVESLSICQLNRLELTRREFLLPTYPGHVVDRVNRLDLKDPKFPLMFREEILQLGEICLQWRQYVVDLDLPVHGRRRLEHAARLEQKVDRRVLESILDDVLNRIDEFVQGDLLLEYVDEFEWVPIEADHVEGFMGLHDECPHHACTIEFHPGPKLQVVDSRRATKIRGPASIVTDSASHPVRTASPGF